jgi:hypothetical protein
MVLYLSKALVGEKEGLLWKRNSMYIMTVQGADGGQYEILSLHTALPELSRKTQYAGFR